MADASAKRNVLRLSRDAIFQIVLWLVTAWLLYPLVALDTVTFYNAKSYLYRTAAGIIIMIVLLGKNIFDLLFPQEISQKKAWLYTALLTVYSLAIAGGIIFMVVRMVILYFKQNQGSSGNTIF
jgi:hypothetical protein